MRNAGESEMTLLNTCVKIKQIVNAIMYEQSTGQKI